MCAVASNSGPRIESFTNTHLEHFNFVRRVWRRKRRVGRGEGGRVIDRCGAEEEGCSCNVASCIRCYIIEIVSISVLTCFSSPTLWRCVHVWVIFLIFYARRTVDETWRGALIIKMFEIIYNIFASLFHLIDFIPKINFNLRWTIIETRTYTCHLLFYLYTFFYMMYLSCTHRTSRWILTCGIHGCRYVSVRPAHADRKVPTR